MVCRRKVGCLDFRKVGCLDFLGFQHFGDEGRGHGADQRAVVELERHFGADRENMAA